MHLIDAKEYPFDDRDLPLEYERNLTDMFVRSFSGKKGDIFVDAGAHLGTWTLRLAPFFEAVIAFEPNPEAFAALQKHVKMNDAGNVILFQKALSLKEGRARLCLHDTPGHSTLEGNVIERSALTGTVEVETITLDSFDWRGRLDLLKIDTEAHELEVLQGGADVLKRDRPRLCIENHSPALRESCLRLLEGFGLGDCTVYPPEHRHHEVYGGYTVRL
jgi:FkbM family methyltransferase